MARILRASREDGGLQDRTLPWRRRAGLVVVMGMAVLMGIAMHTRAEMNLAGSARTEVERAALHEAERLGLYRSELYERSLVRLEVLEARHDVARMADAWEAVRSAWHRPLTEEQDRMRVSGLNEAHALLTDSGDSEI